MPLVVGLTGGIACGKTAVSNAFSNLGIDIIDTDIIAREIVEPGQVALQEIENAFGKEVLQSDGRLNRKKLREIIFSDSSAKQQLEKITHPKIRVKTDEQIKASSSPYCIVVIPLLFETTPNPLINRILVVDCLPEVQLERLIERDNMTKETALNIINQQTSRETRLNGADDVIENNDSSDALTTKVNSLHQKFLALSNM